MKAHFLQELRWVWQVTHMRTKHRLLSLGCSHSELRTSLSRPLQWAKYAAGAKNLALSSSYVLGIPL